MKSLVELVRLLRALFSRPHHKLLYLVSGWAPRKSNLWVFGALKDSFSCNPKYAYLLALSEPESDVEVCWISRNRGLVKSMRARGLPVQYLYDWKGLLTALRAGVYIYNKNVDDISALLGRGALHVNLWHGIPLKKIGRDAEVLPPTSWRLLSGLEKINFLLSNDARKRDDIFLAPAEFVFDYSFRSAFDLVDQQCIAAGYPRNDIFFLSDEDFTAWVMRYEAKESLETLDWVAGRSHVFLYMPTWRDNKRNFVEESGIDFSCLNLRLQSLDAVLLVKLHPNTRLDLDVLQGLSHVRLIDRHEDVYPLMRMTNTLITDYSSVYFDFLLLGRPIIFYAFDLEDYLKDCRDMYFSYLDVTPGALATSPNELLDAMFTSEADKYSAARRHVREKFFEYQSGRATGRLKAAIKRHLEKP